MRKEQIRILQLLADGHTIKEISEIMHYHQSTIKWRLKNIYIEFGIDEIKNHGKPTQAIVIALRRGMIK